MIDYLRTAIDFAVVWEYLRAGLSIGIFIAAMIAIHFAVRSKPKRDSGIRSLTIFEKFEKAQTKNGRKK